MNSIPIALSADENYVPHLGCTMASILKNAGRTDRFHFYVLEQGISEDSRKKLDSLREIHDFERTFVSLNRPLLMESPFQKHAPIALYSRLYLDQLLPDVERMIYLDSDMIVTTSLKELWETDLEGKSLGAAPDIRDPVSFPYLPSAMPLYLGHEETYFNAGTLLLDLAKIRREGLFEQTIQLYAEHVKDMPLLDQDSLNVVFRNDKKVLPFRWNIQVYGGLEREMDRRKVCPEFCESLKEQRGILHFIGKHKPWHYAYYAPAGKAYADVLRLTPWRDYRPPVPPLGERIRLLLAANRWNRFFKKIVSRLKKKKTWGPS